VGATTPQDGRLTLLQKTDIQIDQFIRSTEAKDELLNREGSA